MVYLDLILNLALLVALSVVSGFIDKLFPRDKRLGALFQGALFGGVAVVGMLSPLVLGPGLIFDGRSVMLSLCALFFGPWAAGVSVIITIACRLALGGAGALMGVLVILSSSLIGLYAHYRFKPNILSSPMLGLYGLGLAVHLVMVALMFTLPESLGLATFSRVGLPVILLYPLATLLTGKILSDQLSASQSEAILKEERQRLLYIIEGTNVGTWEWNVQTGDVVFNERWASIIGYTLQEISPVSIETWTKFVHPDDLKASSDLLARHFAGGLDYYKCEARMRHKDGHWVWVLDRGKVSARTEDGKPLLMQGTHQDITERKQAEEMLRESEVHFRTLADSGQMLIWTSGIDKKCDYFNQPWLAFTGRTLAQELGDGWTDGVHPEDLRRCVEIYTGAFDRREKFSMDYRIRRYDGEYRWIQDDGTPRFNSQGDFLGYIGHCLDITEHKQARDEICKLNEDLERKVDERTAELKKTIAQLEETNKAFVGRELRMVQLKEQIAELESRISPPV